MYDCSPKSTTQEASKIKIERINLKTIDHVSEKRTLQNWKISRFPFLLIHTKNNIFFPCGNKFLTFIFGKKQ